MPKYRFATLVSNDSNDYDDDEIESGVKEEGKFITEV